MPEAKFYIGQIVQHKLFDYRGVIFDVDPDFNGDDAWYDAVAKSKPPKDQPWYHILVDNARHETYVAERNIDATDSLFSIKHPLINHYFDNFVDGRYFSIKLHN